MKHAQVVCGYEIVRETIRSDTRFNELIAFLKSHKQCTFDIEQVSTTSIKDDYSKHKREADLTGVSLGYVNEETKTSYTFYCPVGHREVVDVLFSFIPPPSKIGQVVENPLTFKKELVDNQVSLTVALNGIRSLIEDPDFLIIGHNVIYDIGSIGEHLKRRAIPLVIRCKVKDSMNSSYLLHKKKKGLKDRSEKDLGFKMEHLEDFITSYERLDETTIEEMQGYAQDDVVTPYFLVKKHEHEFTQHKAHARKQWVFDNIENPTSIVLAQMEHTGLKIDVNRLRVHHSNLEQERIALESDLFNMVGRNINFRSTEQVSALLFDELKWWRPMRKWDRNKKDLYPCDKDTLEDLCYYPSLTTKDGKAFAELYSGYNSLCTLMSSFTGKIPDLVDSENRVHCRYNQTITSTNRLSSSDPNLQNIPTRTAHGKEIRACFIPEDGWLIVAPDYSQMELRILAHMTEDPMLIKAFTEDIDIHVLTAELVGVDRYIAKTINYSCTYGTGAAKLGRKLKIPKEQAQEYLDRFFERYARLTWYNDMVEKLVNMRGYTKTLFGNTRFYTYEMEQGWYWINKARNHPIQGTSADIVKLAMNKVYEWLIRDNLLNTKVKICAQVHDEIVFEVIESFVETFKARVYEIMMGVVSLIVPMVVDVGFGVNWAEAH